MTQRNERVDRGEYCPHCNLKVQLDGNVRVSRTMPPDDLRLKGVQLAHAICRYENRAAYAVQEFAWLLKGQAEGGIAAYVRRIGNARHPYRELVAAFRTALVRAWWTARLEPLAMAQVEATSRQLADVLGTDQLDLIVVRPTSAETGALAPE